MKYISSMHERMNGENRERFVHWILWGIVLMQHWWGGWVVKRGLDWVKIFSCSGIISLFNTTTTSSSSILFNTSTTIVILFYTSNTSSSFLIPQPHHRPFTTATIVKHLQSAPHQIRWNSMVKENWGISGFRFQNARGQRSFCCFFFNYLRPHQ